MEDEELGVDLFILFSAPVPTARGTTLMPTGYEPLSLLCIMPSLSIMIGIHPHGAGDGDVSGGTHI